MASHGHSLNPCRPDDQLSTRAARLRLKHLEHLCRLHRMTHEKQIALIEEARAARLLEYGTKSARKNAEAPRDETRDQK